MISYDGGTIESSDRDMPENAPYANALTKFMEEPESLRSFLERRKRELAAQVAALRGQIGPKDS